MKKILLSLVTFLVTGSAFANSYDVCLIWNSNGPQVACSDIHEGRSMSSSKTLPVILKEKLDLGYALSPSGDGVSSFILIRK